MKDDYDHDFDDFDDDHEPDQWDDALDNCGMLPEHLGGGCMKSGSEHCEFDCPLRFMERVESGELD